MPSLNTLPPEILISIARLTGSDSFHAHVNRLLVCKAWYQATQAVVCEDIALSTRSLQRFLADPKRIHLRVLAGVRELSIEGRNYEDYDTCTIAGTETEDDHQLAQIEAWRAMGLTDGVS